jgi:hypothetical protein
MGIAQYIGCMSEGLLLEVPLYESVQLNIECVIPDIISCYIICILINPVKVQIVHLGVCPYKRHGGNSKDIHDHTRSQSRYTFLQEMGLHLVECRHEKI